MASPSDDPDLDLPEPANLRFLRRLVTVLTAVMIGGVVAVVGLLVIRYQRPAPLPLPDEIALPDNATAQSVTFGPGFYAVITEDGRLMVFDRLTGALRQTVTLDLP